MWCGAHTGRSAVTSGGGWVLGDEGIGAGVNPATKNTTQHDQNTTKTASADGSHGVILRAVFEVVVEVVAAEVPAEPVSRRDLVPGKGVKVGG